MTMSRHAALALAAALSFAGCADDPTEVAIPDESPAPALQTTVIGLDAHYAALAREVPGFGGAYYDASNRLVVHMAGRELAVEADRIRDQLRPRLRMPDRRATGDGGVVMASSAGQEIVLREATFDYGELVDFHGRAGSVLRVPGAVYTDIDESSNRLRIGVTSRADQAAFLRALGERGVPAEAVTFAVAPQIRPLASETLQDRVQPLGGGLQLVYPHPTPGFIFLCTLGFNVGGVWPGRSVSHFITNSHCTMDQGALDGTPYHQQGIALPDDRYLVAREVMDPPYAPCFGGVAVCRWADAALARYETVRTPVKLGAIYRPESVNTGSLAIAQRGRSFFKITGEAPFAHMDDELSKVGRTTGWTRGEVFATCVHVLQEGSNRVILCQDLVAADIADGDSGAPVFMQHGDSDAVTLYGVAWGGGTGLFAFSGMENIHLELGAFEVR
jgi:hypothetical protein